MIHLHYQTARPHGTLVPLLLFVALLLAASSSVAATKSRQASRMDRTRLNIGAYYLQPYARTETHVKDVADCGIDFIVSMAYDTAALDLFHKYHVGAIVTGILPGWWGGNGNNAGKMRQQNPMSKYEVAAAAFKDKPAIWGVDIGDEPSALDFPYYGEVFRRVQQLFPNQFPYLNLYPNYASVSQNTASQTVNQLGTPTYDKYVRQYFENVTGADYICYDFYLYSINVPEAYRNLISVTNEAARHDKSVWIVLQVNSKDEIKWISENELRFQAFTAMAFGVENIIWACYTAGWWHNQVLDDKGNRTQQYDKLKRVNAEIHHLAKPYMKYRRTATSFVGFQGTKWLDGVSQASVEAYDDDTVDGLRAMDGSPLVVGKMASRKGNGREAFFVCAADDPYDQSPGRHSVRFHSRKRVRVTTADGQYRARRNADGAYEVDLTSNQAVLIELR